MCIMFVWYCVEEVTNRHETYYRVAALLKLSILQTSEWTTEKFHNPERLKDGTFPIILRNLEEQQFYEVGFI